MTNKLALALSFTASAALIAASAIASAAQGGVKLHTTLTGAAEVPGPGDTDARGTASVTVNSGQKQVCYKISVSNIDAATMAHIHHGAAGVAGPVVVGLTAPNAAGNASGCATVTRTLALDILKHPAAYYVNVHNAAFPNGAARGQLRK
jgi:hypothetical protein